MKTFKLDNQPKIETGFKTPDYYFKNFSASVMQQITNEEPKVVSIFQKKKIIILAIAAILIIGLTIPFLAKLTSKSNELDKVTIENYLTYQSGLNQYDLINELDLSDINKIENAIVLEDDAIEEVLSANSNLENLITE